MKNDVSFESKTLTVVETYTTVVEGEDVPECRHLAWEALRSTLGPYETVARDKLDAWVATKMAHGPNPRKGPNVEMGQDPDAPTLACTAEFTREEPGRPTFAP